VFLFGYPCRRQMVLPKWGNVLFYARRHKKQKKIWQVQNVMMDWREEYNETIITNNGRMVENMMERAYN
jgi:hypothetical protein